MPRRRADWIPITLSTAAVVGVAACGKSRDDAAAPAAPTSPAPAAWWPTTHPGCFDPGDLLDVRVLGLNDTGEPTSCPARVQADGTIAVPLLSAPVPVAFAGRVDAARRLADAYRHDNILSQPQVDVRRLEVAGTGASVAGPIGNFDLVRCAVAELRQHGELSVSVVRVDDRGMVSPPLLGSVPVAGLTEFAAAAAVAKAYRDANIVVHAQVSVLVLERAPADAAHKSLPDGPIDPVPPLLRELYLPR